MTAHRQKSGDYLSKAGLRAEFGLTDSLIARLGPPDRTSANPYYRSGPPVQWYARDRVEAWTAEHAEEIAAAALRSQVRKDVASRTAQERVAEAEKVPIVVDVLDQAVLQERAMAAYNDAHEWERASANDDPTFLERITVNFIRHKLTRYDHELERLAGKVGVRRAVRVIRRRVYEAIAQAYPQYAAECRRQWRRRAEEQM